MCRGMAQRGQWCWMWLLRHMVGYLCVGLCLCILDIMIIGYMNGGLAEVGNGTKKERSIVWVIWMCDECCI